MPCPEVLLVFLLNNTLQRVGTLEDDSHNEAY